MVIKAFPRENKVICDYKNNITFQIISWYACDYNYDAEEDAELEEKKYLIKLFGVTDKGESISVNALNFTPYFFIKIPYAVNDYVCLRFKEFINGKMPNALKNSLIDVKIQKKQDFYGFHNYKKFNFLRFTFKSLKAFKQAARLFNSKVAIPGFVMQKYKLYENNIEPFLRMMHIRDIEPCGWVTIKAGQYYPNLDVLQTKCMIDISCKWTAIDKYTCTSMAPFCIVSFDLECTSSHGDFPVPVKDYRKVANELVTNFINIDDIDTEQLIEEFLLIYDHEVPGKLSKVFTKYPELVNTGDIKRKIQRNIDEIIYIIQAKVTYEEYKLITTKAKLTRDNIQQNLLFKLNSLNLPPIEGDRIIQIGSTVHYYGEKTCSYRNIITLGSCEPINDVEVVQCETENEMILKWIELIQKLDPDIITGYNIFGFDFEYIYKRAEELDIHREMSKLSRIIETLDAPYGRDVKDNENEEWPFVKKKLSSSALGDNLLKYIDMQGRVTIDLMKVIQRDHKLDSYKLDTVANHFMKMNKHDISPNDIFRLYKGNAKDRSIIADYCVQDCALCNHLIMKLETLANNIGMANVCYVPLSYIFLRGQSIKIFSLVSKQCREEDIVIPTLNKYEIRADDEDGEPEDESGYEGAIVLEPKTGIYVDYPVSVLDYASLYPSSMISENLSHDTYVIEEKYNNIQGVEYLDISYDLYEGIGDKKKKVGLKTCRFVQTKEKGVLPRILMKLLKQRKETRKKIEFQTVKFQDGSEISGLYSELGGVIIIKGCDGKVIGEYPKDTMVSKDQTYNEFQQAVLDGLQLAYKVTANSLYGQCGAKTSPIYMKEVAASTTATGRNMIMKAKGFIEDNYDAEIIYGDSVTGDTPVIIRRDNRIHIVTIESLNESWADYPGFKIEETDLYNKEQGFINAQVWSNGQWADIKRVIRHKCNKKIYRVNTLKSYIDVTEDHSLIDTLGNKIKPDQCDVNTELMHSFPDSFQNLDNYLDRMTKSDAWLYGLFYTCGSLDTGEWVIKNSNKEMLNIAMSYLSSEYTLVDSQIVCTNPEVIQKYRELFYDKNNKVVPNVILNSSITYRRWFLDSIILVSQRTQNRIVFAREKTKIGAQSLYYLIKSVGWNNLNIDFKDGLYWITYIIEIDVPYNIPNTIQDITEIGLVDDYDYVYDIETSCGKFHAGVGELVVSNTDSLFVKFNNRDSEGNLLKGKEALKPSIHTACEVSKEFRKTIKAPHDLEYEKTFWPFILLSKKRYIANKYEFDVDHYKQSSMGVVLRRRDNANIVKTVYGGIIDIILNETNIGKSIEFLNDSLQKMITGQYPLEEFIISKSLKSDYKDPTRISHKVLADRMKERDPGSAPQVNDRLPYAYIQVDPTKFKKGVSILQGDRIEHPTYIREHNLKLDYEFYLTNQLMNPILQIYALILEDLNGYKKSRDHFTELYDKLLIDKKGDVTKAKTRVQDLRDLEVQKLLFDPFIIKLQNKRLGNREITDFFKVVK